jgi:hypothetical protein
LIVRHAHILLKVAEFFESMKIKQIQNDLCQEKL